MNSKQRDALPAALSGAVRSPRRLGPRWLSLVTAFLLGCGAGILFLPWVADRAGVSLPGLAGRAPAGRPLGVLLIVALGLGAVVLWLLFARLAALARRARIGERFLARLAQAVPADDESEGGAATERAGHASVAASADRRLDQVLSGYRSAMALTARVAELERELDRARAGASRGDVEPVSPAPFPAADHGSLPPAEPSPMAEPERAATAIDPERVRQLAEGTFLTGSDALVRVRSAIRLVQECRQRPGVKDAALPADLPANGNGRGTNGAGVDRHEVRPEGPLGARPAEPLRARPTGPLGAPPRAPLGSSPRAPLGELFVALAAEVDDLSRSARGLRPVLEALLVTPAGRRNGSLAPHVLGWKPSSGGTLSILKCRALSVELERGLRRLGAEVQLLSRSRRSLGPGADASDVRGETDRGLAHGLRRLELALEEVAAHLANLTRNAEQLSRELDRPRARP